MESDLERLANRRARQLDSSTRSEILVSLGAAVFFVAVLAGTRLISAQEGIPQIAFIAVILWVLVCLYRFRDRIWRKEPRNAPAATSLENYRNALERRRDHLRTAWIWHGPLLLACLALIAILIGKAAPDFHRLRNAAPFLVLLAVWTGFTYRQRRRQANELQREIDEIGQPGQT